MHLKKSEFLKYPSPFVNLSNWILLCGPPGSEIYREALIRALARKLEVNLIVVEGYKLVLDSEGRYFQKGLTERTKERSGNGTLDDADIILVSRPS